MTKTPSQDPSVMRDCCTSNLLIGRAAFYDSVHFRSKHNYSHEYSHERVSSRIRLSSMDEEQVGVEQLGEKLPRNS